MAALVVRSSILSILLLAIVVTVNGQGAINLQKRISIPANAIQLDSLLHVITRQSGAKFSINTRKFPAFKSITIKDHTPTIGSLLQVIKQTTGVYYATLGDHIILLDNPPPGKKNTANTVNKRTTPAPKNTVVKSKPPALVKKATVIDPLPASSPSLPILLPKPDTTVKQPLPIAQSIARKKAVTTNNKPASPANEEKEISGLLTELFVKAGVSADDLFYGNAIIHIGHPYFYGIASYSTNFNISGYRYGIGASIPLSDVWKLHLQVTTGNLSSKFDTSTINREYKTKLHRAGLVAETDLGEHFKLQFGPVFNLMKITFYRDGKKMAPSLPVEYIDKKFELLKPVYTFTNTFSPNVAISTKSWVGLQISLFYNFNFSKRE